MPVVPVMVQYWFRQERQIPAYLRGMQPREDQLGFDLSALPGASLIGKTHNEAIDTGCLHEELVAGGLKLTHASRLNRFYDPYFGRFYYVLRFHYFPSQTAVIHDGVDVEKLVLSLEEINKMGFWGVRADLNRGRVCPWISVSCKDRTQRYTGEDLDRPEMRRLYNELGEKVGSAPVAADRVLHYLGDNRLGFGLPLRANK